MLLSLFPGLGMLDAAFREQGYCVVNAGDLTWGSLYDIRDFHAERGAFEGVVGGPPCQEFSKLAALVRANGYEPHFGNLIPEFERVVAEAHPMFFLMENVPQAPVPVVKDYIVHSIKLNNRWLAGSPEQNRERVFSFGSISGRNPWPYLEVACLEAPQRYVNSEKMGGADSAAHAYSRDMQTVIGSSDRVPVALGGSGKRKPGARVERIAGSDTSSDGSGKVKMARYGLEAACELQGLPRDFFADSPYTKAGALKLVANGVCMHTGRAVTKAIKEAMDAR